MLRVTFVPCHCLLCTSPGVFFYSLKSMKLDFCSLMLTTTYESKNNAAKLWEAIYLKLKKHYYKSNTYSLTLENLECGGLRK